MDVITLLLVLIFGIYVGNKIGTADTMSYLRYYLDNQELPPKKPKIHLINKKTSKTEEDKEIEKVNQLLDNINNYDGTEKNQEKIKGDIDE